MHRKIVPVLLMIGVLVVVNPALAKHKNSFSAKLTITATRNAAAGEYMITGKLKSSKKLCVKGRRLKVYLRKAGEPRFSFIAEGPSSSDGKWSLGDHYLVPPGQYYAKAAVKRISNFTCKAATSPTITGTA